MRLTRSLFVDSASQRLANEAEPTRFDPDQTHRPRFSPHQRASIGQYLAVVSAGRSVNLQYPTDVRSRLMRHHSL